MIDYQNYAVVIGWIKELLHNFNLPMIPVYTENTILYEGRSYIKDNFISTYSSGTFNNISRYTYNREVLNLTKTLTINSSIYDQHTHEYLGDYLRFLRDYNKLNLMGMYNCFNGKQPRKIYYSATLEKDKSGEIINSYVINTSDDNYNFYIVPVKFNEKYTIAIDSNCIYDMCCILYDNKFISNTPDDLIKQSLKVVRGSKFVKPFIYSTYFNCAEDIWYKEKSLVLLLKLPKSINSTITILEGDYTLCHEIIDGCLINKVTYGDDFVPDVFNSKNSLIDFNGRKNYPFSDRLIEYLINNTIDQREDIPLNVYRIQKLLYNDDIKGFKDLWSDVYIKNKIIEYMHNEDLTKGSNSLLGRTIKDFSASNNEKTNFSTYKISKKFKDDYQDLTGYVDKDVELFLSVINNYKTKVIFNDTDNYIYAVYNWDLVQIDVPEKEGYIFKGYYSLNDDGTFKKQYYDDDGNGICKWDIKQIDVTLYPKWEENNTYVF